MHAVWIAAANSGAEAIGMLLQHAMEQTQRAENSGATPVCMAVLESVQQQQRGAADTAVG